MLPRGPNIIHALGWLLLPILVVVSLASHVVAATSEPFESQAMTARLITVEDGVAPDASTLSAGLHLDLNADWKSYWRSPGQVGLAPEIDWSGSKNVASVEFLWPVPTRFRAFGIENFGYKDEIVYPLKVALERAGEPATLAGNATILVCEEVCVPETFKLSLSLSEGTGIDANSAALISRFAQQVPPADETSDLEVAFSTDGSALVVHSETKAFADAFLDDGYYGAPDIRPMGDGTWASFSIIQAPETDDFAVTVIGADGAFEFQADTRGVAPPAPDAPSATKGGTGFASALLLAFVGGLILNVMPCVLPVLSIKLASVAASQNKTPQRVRRGFVATALGVLLFVWVLAAGTIALRSAGVAVGWGMQFQNAPFLAFALVLIVLFSANLFGLFEFRLPSSVNGRMASDGDADGYWGDVGTGAFAALLATPCSAPFLGTAVAFALTGSATDVWLIFTALGFGLALPYLVVALFPRAVNILPKPGPWMVALRSVLGVMLAGSALWLAWVLAGVAGMQVAIAVVAIALLAVALVSVRSEQLRTSARIASVALLVGAVILPVMFQSTPRVVEVASDYVWRPFDRGEIARSVSQGHVVFVDVTADWCLTCKVNKSTTLSRDPIASLLEQDGIDPMRADWTRTDDAIRAYLNDHGRYGIPFNAVYGPGAPEGILLPEILLADDVIEAIERARGSNPATTKPSMDAV